MLLFFSASVFILEMYNDLMSEQPTTPEDSVKKRLVKTLKEKGQMSPEARELFGQWYVEQEKILSTEANPVGLFDHSFWRAQIYLEAGLLDACIQALNDAKMMASQEGEPDHWDQADAEIERVQKMKP